MLCGKTLKEKTPNDPPQSLGVTLSPITYYTQNKFKVQLQTNTIRLPPIVPRFVYLNNSQQTLYLHLL